MKEKMGWLICILAALLLLLAEETARQREQERGENMGRYMLAGRLKIPTQEEVTDNPYIYRYNHELIKEKGLMDGDRLSFRYLCMQAVYRANLDAYLLDEIDIRKLDEELKNSELGFVSRKQEEKSLYEKESEMGLELIYLRNNLYIEYLDQAYLELLEHQLETGKEAVTEELKSMVKESYQEIIRVRDLGAWQEEVYFRYPGVQGAKPEIPNHALVLGISNVLEYDESGNLCSEEDMRKRCEYLEKIKIEKEEEYSRILGTEVYILAE